MKLTKKPVNGMKEILPAEMKIRDYAISVIKETYAKFGFTSIETPCMEHIENLSNKQGGENEKLSFPIVVVVARISSISARLLGSPKISISHCIN